MAYWGEALTFAQLLWGIDYADSARAALARLGPTRDARLARARTARERQYGAAIEALFDTTSVEARARGYVAGLRAVDGGIPQRSRGARAARHLAAAGRSGSSAEQAKARTEESIALAQSVFAKAPQHPGGAHYLIHAADNPKYAARGLAAARAYAKIAPDAEHALHMPSHIFVQVGAWDDVVSSNERAWAGVARVGEVARRAEHGAQLPLALVAAVRLPAAGAVRRREGAARHGARVLDGIDWASSDAIDARYAAEQFRFSTRGRRATGRCTVARHPSPVAANPKVTGDRAPFFASQESYRTGRSSPRCSATRRSRSASRTRCRTLRRSRAAKSSGCWRRRAATRRTGSRRSRRRRSWTRRNAHLGPPSSAIPRRAARRRAAGGRAGEGRGRGVREAARADAEPIADAAGSSRARSGRRATRRVRRRPKRACGRTGGGRIRRRERSWRAAGERTAGQWGQTPTTLTPTI